MTYYAIVQCNVLHCWQPLHFASCLKLCKSRRLLLAARYRDRFRSFLPPTSRSPRPFLFPQLFILRETESSLFTGELFFKTISSCIGRTFRSKRCRRLALYIERKVLSFLSFLFLLWPPQNKCIYLYDAISKKCSRLFVAFKRILPARYHRWGVVFGDELAGTRLAAKDGKLNCAHRRWIRFCGSFDAPLSLLYVS